MKTADPGACDRRGTSDRDQGRELAERRSGFALGDRCDDAKSLGHVVHHEPDDQERAEHELAERERRADRKPLAEVVQADTDRHQRCEAETAERAVALAGAARGEPATDPGEREVATGDADEREPDAAEGAGKQRLQLERPRRGRRSRGRSTAPRSGP